MMSKTTPLGELVNVQTGKLDANASSADGAYPFFTCAREPLRIAEWKYDLDAILIAGNGDLNVKHYAGKFDAYQRTYILDVKNAEVLDTRFLFHFMDKYVERLREQSIGGIIKYIKLGMLTEAQIPLPPLEEQKRIAGILDQADALRRLRTCALDKLNTLGQAIFHEMFGEDFRANKMIPLGDLTTKIGSGATPRGGDAAYKKAGIPLIRSMNVRDGSFDGKGLAFLDDDQADGLKNVVVQANDVLLNITGASVARVTRAPSDMANARVNQHVAIIRPTQEILPEFLEAFLLLPSIKRNLLSIAEAGATRQAITKSQIEEFKVPVIPLGQQQAYVDRKKNIAIFSTKSAEQHTSFQKLFASLQHRAFRGEV